MKISLTLIYAVALCGVVNAQRKSEEPLVSSQVLSQLMPSIKAAKPVVIKHNVFSLGETVAVRFVSDGGHDRSKQLAVQLQDVIDKQLGSVIRQSKTAAVILFDRKVFRPGDELYLGKSSQPLPLIPKCRVIFSAISTDAIEFSVIGIENPRTEERVQIQLNKKYQD